MRCPKCNDENAAGTRFCRRCGEKMGGARLPWVAIGVALVVGAVAAWFALRSGSNSTIAPAIISSPATTIPPVATDSPITVGIAYGTEKRDWLTWAVAEFNKTDDARGIHIELKPMGSLDAAHAILRSDKTINVWSPASALYKDVFVRGWKDAHAGEDPILRESPLALTPMVFVAWEQRYDAFAKHYGEMNFHTISQAMGEETGWKAIADQPEWMFFKFSHTKPDSSNSGLMSLLLMGYDYHAKFKGLDGRDITDAGFSKWLSSMEHGLAGSAGGLTASTGDLMTSMVQRGWSTYDVIFVYENVAIDRLRQANGRWGNLRIVYPKYNMWNDNPYYVLNVPWSSPAQRQAAKIFLDFLLTEPIQREAMAHGFRPANVQVPTNTPDSPFVRYQSVGVKADVPGIFCEPPRAEVIENLLLAWERGQQGN